VLHCNAQIRFRAVAKVTRRNTLAPGTPVWFSTSVAVNSDYIYVGQVQITVTDETSFTNSSYNVVRLDGFSQFLF
jgi:hypothetical protein